jgi:hypothetical protein
VLGFRFAAIDARCIVVAPPTVLMKPCGTASIFRLEGVKL